MSQDERVLSFVPPDGNFRLLTYHIASQSSMAAIPVYVRHNISFRDQQSGRMDITVGPRQTMGRMVGVGRVVGVVWWVWAVWWVSYGWCGP